MQEKSAVDSNFVLTHAAKSKKATASDRFRTTEGTRWF